MKILSIETSCDETAVAVIDVTGTEANASFNVQGNALYSQAKKHAQYGGVYPTLAKREHAKNLVPLLKDALSSSSLLVEKENIISDEKIALLQKLLQRETGLAHALVTQLKTIQKPPIDAIAVTKGPGLEPALWVGVNFARALSSIWDTPIIPVNHLEGHMIASAVEQNLDNEHIFNIKKVDFPALGLIISGGHTEFVYAEKWGSYKIVGSTRDDSIGEAFDKVARILELPYPGGPKISALAKKGRSTLATRPAHLSKNIRPLPRPMSQTQDLDFSFSGLKTAVLYMVRDMGDISDIERNLIAAEFEEAVADVIITKTQKALKLHPVKTLLLGGGVSANEYIREKLVKLFAHEAPHCVLHLPATGLSTDNAVMIGMAGYYMHLRGEEMLDASDELSALGNLSFS